MPGSDDLTRLRRALDAAAAPSSDFDLNAGAKAALPPTRKLRPAGVLVPLIDSPEGLRLILTKRSSKLKHHPGQIAFPGGKVDPTDAGPEDAALRETEEEIGLPRASVSLLGALPVHETVTGFAMAPFVGLVTGPFAPRAEPGEVAEIFSLPFAHVTEAARFSVQSRRWRGERRHYFTVPYGPYYIWGATARILRGLAERLSP
ncbi:CoA pyrophosphatase [Roseivivax sp. GX 12232]|uniref:CoA pyrophosphatase n=1 Tax=Roseivivax sp. GX 12232 TaxID=2900547 RepID=UPI001E42B8F1|nr:CoA pyrophosphatase [Roseivivax sp. GX 12232]MCE0506334.1 CoA pyrophosphatase [Roseivivax sp. GX 12232]